MCRRSRELRVERQRSTRPSAASPNQSTASTRRCVIGKLTSILARCKAMHARKHLVANLPFCGDCLLGVDAYDAPRRQWVPLDRVALQPQATRRRHRHRQTRRERPPHGGRRLFRVPSHEPIDPIEGAAHRAEVLVSTGSTDTARGRASRRSSRRKPKPRCNARRTRTKASARWCARSCRQSHRNRCSRPFRQRPAGLRRPSEMRAVSPSKTTATATPTRRRGRSSP